MINKALTISVEQADRLFWLGRYVERVYSTLRLFNTAMDTMIDVDEKGYVKFCQCLSIPSDIYAGRQDFEASYLFSEANPDSIYANLSRAYDNGIVLRNFISTESLSYLQMALDKLKAGGKAQSAFLSAQQVIDWLLGFWGSLEETINDPQRRNLIKIGKYVERMDLALRLDLPYEVIDKTMPRLINRANRTGSLMHLDRLQELVLLAQGEAGLAKHKERALELVNSLHLNPELAN
ncbi:MAG: alpha-E domain-containing protein [Duodenibacillus sp.]|nr:alpha-E domain-containing protein [Duodenibacillus sp.]